jgi:amino acid adenylation domain-containing protein
MNGISASAGEKLASLSKDRAQLLKLLLESNCKGEQQIQPYPRAARGLRVLAPPSWAQERLWLLDQLEGGSPAYHIMAVLRLRGSLDKEGLRKALDTLLERHEVLRTVLVSIDGNPTQEIGAASRFSLELVDLSGYSDSERNAQIETQKLEEARAEFNLAVGPLIRARLLRLGAEEHLLLLAMHHIISDGWSIGVLIRELAALYAPYREGRDNPVPPLPIQYADYAQWQREPQQAESLNEQLSYWRAHLQGAAPQLEFPTDRSRPPVQSHRGDSIELLLDAGLCTDLKALAQRHQLTLFMVLYAAWAILLLRLSGQKDIVVGTPTANRQLPELEGLIGFFVNTLVLRLQVRSDAQLSELLQQAKEVTLGAFEHQDVPFERIVEALQPQRSPSRHPIFQVMLVLQNTPKSELCLPGLTVTLEDGVTETSMFDVLLSLEERNGAMAANITYATDLFDRATIERWLASFKVLLQGMTEHPDWRIDELPILPESERRQVLESFNATGEAFPEEMLIHQLFEQQVELMPDTLALIYDSPPAEGERLTYAELNRRANQLARYLRSRGVGPDRPVAICVERSLEMVVGLLGILKAGGAYIPLDPDYPTERLTFMLNDAAPEVLLTQERVRANLPTTAAEPIALDSDWSQVATHETNNLDPNDMGLHSRHLAYMIYTSGSTGAPKGAMNEHRALINRLQWMQRQYQLGACDRVLQKTPFSFDVSVWEFFWTLMSGARLVVARPRGHQDPDYLIKLIEEQGVTTVHFVPSMLQAFLDRHRSGECPSLRRVICSGEELPASLQKQFFEHLPQAALSNLYGPTEAAIDVTSWECSSQDQNSRVPIGRPISNTRMYILDGRGTPVPIGVAGEIHIGGAGVGRGYLNRPALTAERFVRDPFVTDPDARLYKTGDLGRWRADGAIEYLGRNDHQVKIRGFRVELGEIETRLAQQSRVKEAVVIAREDIPGEKRLVAYVVPTHEANSNGAQLIEALRTNLKGMLPEHMVPAAFMLLEKMPVTPNGKLDRRALPAPDSTAYSTPRYEAPQGEVEEGLAAIWRELLHLQQVGRQDNFFEIGGHSLTGIKLIAKIAERFNVKLAAMAVFQYPTIQQMAPIVESVQLLSGEPALHEEAVLEEGTL